MQIAQYGSIAVKIFDTRGEMGKVAAQEAGECLRALLAHKDEVNCIFASAPSQNELLDGVAHLDGVDWTRVNAFHMDEYIGLPVGDCRSFSGYLMGRILGVLPFKSEHVINGMAPDPEEECRRYAALLERHPVDVTFMGIGENGHIAFNDPPVADFADPLAVKVVELEHACRVQQVNDGCFATIDDVPATAITLTIPALLKAANIFCVVPGTRKAEAVRNTLTGPIDVSCPASALRGHPGVRMYVDNDAMSAVK